MDLFVPAVALLALVKKFVDFSKYITNKDINGALTQLYVWVVGVAGTWLFAQSQWADHISFGDIALSAMNFASILIVGVGLASTAGVTTDVIKATDNTDSASMPKLLPGVQDGPTGP